jgi:hypothetical protein
VVLGVGKEEGEGAEGCQGIYIVGRRGRKPKKERNFLENQENGLTQVRRQ